MDENDRLDSWKQIAGYLGKSERTVRRWQETEGLPVHRHLHQQRGSVWAYRAELNAWLAGRRESPGAPELPTPGTPTVTGDYRSRWLLIGVGVALMAGAAAAIAYRSDPPRPEVLEPVQITALPGAAYAPTFSPDGKQVAFHWAPEGGEDPGIYRKLIGGETHSAVVLTKRDSGQFLYSPAWSPDGKTIAFLRRVLPVTGFSSYATASETWLCLVAATGGPDRRLVRIAEDVIYYANSSHLSWTPDGQWLFAPMSDGERKGIHRISVVTGEPHRVTPGINHEFAPTLSPDARSLVFMRQSGPSAASIEQVLRQDLAPDGSPIGTMQQLFKGRSMSSGLAWLPNGKELLFCTADSALFGAFNSRLHRLAAYPPQVLRPTALGGCTTVAVSSPDPTGRVSVVYGDAHVPKSTIFKNRLATWDEPVPFASSSRFDALPSYSPDGALVAFVSNRSGDLEIWLAKQDGTGVHRLTSKSHVASIPRWAPDGTRIVYGSAELMDDGSSTYALNIVPITGGVSTRITVRQRAPSDPSWSVDGRWIYFWVESELWRTTPDGGTSQSMGTYPAHFVRPVVADEHYMYYARSSRPFALYRTNLQDRKEQLLSDGLGTPFFAVTSKFVYFIGKSDAALSAFPLPSGPVRRIGAIRNLKSTHVFVLGLSASPDDQHIVWAVTGRPQTDLQLLRDYR
jgi:Tol biopolymer transport system component